MVKGARWLAIVAAMAALPRVAHAQIDNAGVLDQALRRFREAAQGWQDAAHGAATSLFWALATVSLVWTVGQLALRRAELGEFFAELVRYLLFTGFWAWMLENGPLHAQLIMDSMVAIGDSAVGSRLRSPSGVLDVGFYLLDRALLQSSIQSPVESTLGIVMALGTLTVLALVGVNMLVTMIACWIVAYGGLIVLGFGGCKWTSDMASNYYRMILSLGLQVLAMVLLVGVGEGLLRDYFSRLEETVNVRELAVMLVNAIVLLVTVNRVPPLLGTLANGSSPQHALGAGAGAGAALSALSAAGAVTAMASSPVFAGAQTLSRAAAAAFLSGRSGGAELTDGFQSETSRETQTAGSVFPGAPDVTSADGRGAQPSGLGATTQGTPGSSSSVPNQDGADTREASPEQSSDVSSSPQWSDPVDLQATDADRDQPSDDTSAPSDSASQDGVQAGRAADEKGTEGVQATASSELELPPQGDARHAPPESTPHAGSASAQQLSAASAPPQSTPTPGNDPARKDPQPFDASSPPSHATIPATAGAPSAEPARTATIPSAPALMTAMAGATMQAAASMHETGFANLSPPPPAGGKAPPAPTPIPPSAAASELHAASSAQTSVDVEAEVAAFRDQEQ